MLLICVVRFISLGIKYVMCDGGVLVWIHVNLRFCLVDTFCTGFFVIFFLRSRRVCNYRDTTTNY